MNDNQLIVLNWMKRISGLLTFEKVLGHLNCMDSITEDVHKAYMKLNKFEKYQIIQEFGKWGMEQEN